MSSFCNPSKNSDAGTLFRPLIFLLWVVVALNVTSCSFLGKTRSKDESLFINENPTRSTSSVDLGSVDLEIRERVILDKLNERADGFVVFQYSFTRVPDLDDSKSEFYTDPGTCELRTLLDKNRFGQTSRWVLRPQKILAELSSQALSFNDIETGLRFELRCQKNVDGSRWVVQPTAPLIEVLTQGRWILSEALQSR